MLHVYCFGEVPLNIHITQVHEIINHIFKVLSNCKSFQGKKINSSPELFITLIFTRITSSDDDLFANTSFHNHSLKHLFLFNSNFMCFTILMLVLVSSGVFSKIYCFRHPMNSFTVLLTNFSEPSPR